MDHNFRAIAKTTIASELVKSCKRNMKLLKLVSKSSNRVNLSHNIGSFEKRNTVAMKREMAALKREM